MDILVDSAARMVPPSASRRWVPYAGSPYLIGEQIGAGGMGTVHLGLKCGALGFRRLLAIKRLHGHLAQEPEFVARFMDEIRLVSRLSHANLVQTLDVLEAEGELALVMEFVEGVTFHHLLKDAKSAETQLPVAAAVGTIAQALHGLHSAHESLGDDGSRLHLVHRDVSPQNIIVGRDGLVKVLDFGVAKAASGLHVTRTGQLSGKVSYMAPEQVSDSTIDRRTDVFAAGVVLWEALTGQRLFRPADGPEVAALNNVLSKRVRPPGELREGLSPALERIVLRALDREPARRFGSARDFALALEEAVPEASVSAVSSAVTAISGSRLTRASEILLPPVAGEPAPATVVMNAARQERHDGRSPTVMSATIAAGMGATGLTTQDLAISSVTSTQRTPGGSGYRRALLGSVFVLGLGALLVAGALRFQTERAVPAALATPGSGLRIEAPTPVPPREPPEPARIDHAESAPPAAGAERDPGGGPAEPTLASPSQDEVEGSTSAPQHATSGAQRARVRPPTRRTTRQPKTQAPPIGAPPDGIEKSVNQGHPAAEASNCSPPTYTDAEGIRHFKPECL